MWKKFRAVIQILRGGRAFLRIVKDPQRINEVFTISDEVTDKSVLYELATHFSKEKEGVVALHERRRLTLNLEQLFQFPEGSLGRIFATHMRDNNLDPAAIPTLPSEDAADFVNAHLYETHDIWHVVTGFNTDVAGEMGLLAFYSAQLPSPFPPTLIAAGLLNTAFYRRDDLDRRMKSLVDGWTAGRRARSFFGTRWDTMWAMPLAEVRARMGISGASLLERSA